MSPLFSGLKSIKSSHCLLLDIMTLTFHSNTEICTSCHISLHRWCCPAVPCGHTFQASLVSKHIVYHMWWVWWACAVHWLNVFWLTVMTQRTLSALLDPLKPLPLSTTSNDSEKHQTHFIVVTFYVAYSLQTQQSLNSKYSVWQLSKSKGARGSVRLLGHSCALCQMLMPIC